MSADWREFVAKSAEIELARVKVERDALATAMLGMIDALAACRPLLDPIPDVRDMLDRIVSRATLLTRDASARP